jgi:hypothetical protein
MFDDGFRIMLSKFSADANLELRWRKHVEEQVRRRHILTQRLNEYLKRIFLVIALVGVGVGIYYGNDLGWVLGQMSCGTSSETDPSLHGIPDKNLKRVRKLQELNQKHLADYDEVDKMLSGGQ